MSQHTPGPWRVDYGQGTGRGTIYPSKNSVFTNELGRTGSVANAHLPPLYDKAGKGFSEEAFAVMEANARLIAAAPELVETVRLLADELYEALEYLRAEKPAIIHDEDYGPVNDARALLAKIEGKE